ncbi:efflux RND transporter permease subunit [Nannocystaceae bacterium ST9]
MIRFFIHRPALVHVITIAVLLLGLVVIARTQREGFPAVTVNTVVITTIMPGASPDDVEAKLTIPIEEAIRELDGIEEYSSVSREGLSRITIELFEDLGPEQVEQVELDLQKALDAIPDLPPELESPPVLSRFNPSKMIVMEVALIGPDDRLAQAVDRLQPQLEAIPGVGVVHQVGLGDPEIEVLLDPVRARAQQVTLDEVMAALQRRNVASTGGRLMAWPEQKQVVLSGEYRDVEAIAATILRFRGPAGGALTIGDVAQVRMTREELGLRPRADGQPSVALLIRKRETADILDTVDAVYALLASVELPEGVEARVYNDLSRQTRNRLSVVISNGIGGVILVLAVLLLFLTGRIAFWVAFGMPFALIGTATLMPLLGITINMISLAGFVLVIGIVVDDAIVVSERVAYYIEQGVALEDATLRGAREMALPVLGSSLTTILAFTPLFLLGGLPGKFSWAIPVIVILTLSVSLFECFFILPSHIVGHHHSGPGGVRDDPEHAPSDRRARGKARWIVALERVYAAILHRLLRFAPLVVLGFAALFVVTIQYLRTSVPVVLFPQDDSDAIYLKIAAPLGTPIERTEAIVRGLEQQLPQIVGDDLEGMTARIGHQDFLLAERVRGSAEHEAYVALYLRDDRAHGAHAWIAQIEANLHVPEGVEVVFDARRIGPPLGQPVQVHVSSRDDDVRLSAAAEVRSYLAALPGVVDLESDERAGVRQIDLRLDHRRMALEQVPVTTVARAIQAAFFGLPVTELRQGQDPLAIRVRFEPAARADLDLLLASSVRGDDGRLHALRELVEPVEVDALAARHRRQGVRTTTFTGRIDPRSGETASSLAARMHAELAPAMAARRAEQGSDLEVTIAGEASKTGETLGEMPLVFGLALLGIVLIVTLLSGSLTQALFVISAVPLGLIGVVWAYAAHGLPISLFALLGVTGLAGVVVNDAIVMVDALGKTGTGSSEAALIDEVAAIAAERLRPVLLTTLTTVAGVMPTAYGLGGRDAVLSPMSLALGYGLTFATAITLILIPSFYVIRRRMERRQDARKARRRARRRAA